MFPNRAAWIRGVASPGLKKSVWRAKGLAIILRQTFPDVRAPSPIAILNDILT